MKRRPWETGEPLDVACWCGHRMRRFPQADVWAGTVGWSCGKPECTEAAS